MSDNVATRRRQSVADTLREYVKVMHERGVLPDRDYEILISLADEIDRQHNQRMEDCRRETRRSTCKYISRVVADYKRGKKWKRKEYGGSNEREV